MIARLMGLKTIAPAELMQRIREGRVTSYDLNARSSWIAAHVPGAQPLDPIGYSDSDLPADKSSSLVFYCSNPLCRKAPNAAKRALSMGYSDVRVMSSGISGWLAAGLPVESGK